jgi:hypothetical protein
MKKYIISFLLLIIEASAHAQGVSSPTSGPGILHRQHTQGVITLPISSRDYELLAEGGLSGFNFGVGNISSQSNWVAFEYTIIGECRQVNNQLYPVGTCQVLITGILHGSDSTDGTIVTGGTPVASGSITESTTCSVSGECDVGVGKMVNSVGPGVLLPPITRPINLQDYAQSVMNQWRGKVDDMIYYLEVYNKIHDINAGTLTPYHPPEEVADRAHRGAMLSADRYVKMYQEATRPKPAPTHYHYHSGGIP